MQAIDLIGLSEVEAQRRRQQGQVNVVNDSTSRTYTEIIRSNVFNSINLILFGLGGLLIGIGRVSDAVTSVGIVGVNVVIGVYQEIRTKQQLDKIALLTRPRVTMIRDGQAKETHPSKVVLGDLIQINAGDQMVVDGVVVGECNAEIDESLLSGEGDLIQKMTGDEILSGSFCVAGSGYFEVTRVGGDSFANKLTANAREFQIVQTPLQKEINLLLRLLILLAGFLISLLLTSAILSETPFVRQVQLATVIVGLIPNGLFLMVILAYALGAVRIVRQGALVQQSNAVESLSRVTVLCTDKTGTLTSNRIVYDNIHPISKDATELAHILADVASSLTSPNKTTQAIINELGGSQRMLIDEIPFSSRLKWSAVSFEEGGVYALGALEMLKPYLAEDANATERVMEQLAEEGKRVLAFAYHPQSVKLHDENDKPNLDQGCA